MRLFATSMILLAALLIDVLIEHASTLQHRQQQQLAVLEQLALIRAKLEGEINANLHLLNGIAAAISVEKQFSDEWFERLARSLLKNRHHLLNIAAAPDLVVRYVYPLEGNETVLGLDYMKNDQQRAAALQARDLDAIVVAGPVQLIQGGEGLIARLPVFVPQIGGEQKFWGLVSSVIDSQALFVEVGIIENPELELKLALRGKDAKGPEGAVFLGDAELFENNAVVLDVNLPYGAWQLAAEPLNGWYLMSPDRWWIRAGTAAIALSALVLMTLRFRFQQQQRQRQAMLYSAFEHSPLGMLIIDKASQKFEFINQSLQRLLVDDASSPANTITPELIQETLADQLQFEHQGELSRDIQVIVPGRMQAERTWRCFQTELDMSNGTKLLVLIEDTTERNKLQKQLQLSKRIIDNTSDAVVITNANTEIVSVNEAFCKITGYSRDEVMGQNPSLYKSCRHDQYFYTSLWQQVNETGKWIGEVWNKKKNGEEFPCWLTINRIGNIDQPEYEYIGVFSDVSDIKRAEKDLERIAYYDPLTSLPNRVLFGDRLKKEISNSKRHDQRLALLFLDLDRFKYVNDSFGHSVGDELLKVIAKRLVSVVRENDTITRLGGDEFTVIISELKNINGITRVVQRMLESIGQPINLAGQELHVGASIGIAVYPDDGADAETLVRHADMAMYQAKEQGRNGFHFFTNKLQQDMSSRLMLESQLRQAVDEQQFELYYQPKVELASGRIMGMEALIRWNHPDDGFIPPDSFIPIAEETGLINPIGHWVIEEACRQTQQWHALGFTHLRVAVNLSARQFDRDDLSEDISRIIASTQLPADALELEITESMVVDKGDRAIKTLSQLRSLGVEISIDDFGTGYSNLQYLKRFPLNSLKIDRGFVQDLAKDREDKAIIKAIILMAKSLGLSVVAEGIEKQEELDFLLEQHCPMGQGYLFSRPLPADEFINWVKTHQSEHYAQTFAIG